MVAGKEAKIFLDVKTSDGTPFKINTFRGVERLSDLFEYTLLMTARSRDVNFKGLMGQSATVSLSVGPSTRTYNGIIGRFEQEDTPFQPIDEWTTYRAILYPKLWLLNFSGQCRIFQNKSALQIITTILGEHQITCANQVTSHGMQPRVFCVQYNETDLNFISRLMEEEGIFYFFHQNQGTHTLVLADSGEAHLPCPEAPSVRFHDAAPQEQFMMTVSSCFLTQRIVPTQNTLKSFNYLRPQNPLKATAAGDPQAGGGEITTYDEIYDEQGRGDGLVKVQIQSEEVPQKRAEGVSTVPFFLAGYRFNLQNHPRKDANLVYVLYEVIHEAKIVTESPKNHLYKNSYRAFPVSIPFRPPQKTPKPRIYGTQTAKVTGKPGEEIYTEEYGRIKVKFHWDPSPSQDDTTSCWIRVATLWAGQQWGTLFTPRVGQEVVVSFIDGDPDNPLVVGSVYNGENKPPYLPSEPTKSTLKSQTSKKGDDPTPGYNEFRFEDKKFSEEIYIHAQKDFKIDIQNDHNIKIVGGNRSIILESQAEHEEQRQGTQSNDSLKLMNGDKSLEIIKGNYTIRLDDGNIKITCANGNLDFDVNGNISFNCTGNFNVNAAKSISLDAASSFSAKAGGSATMAAGGSATVEAGGSATVEAGATLNLTATAMVNVRGLLIRLNS
ncbi:MAG: type VI secretion system tip protein VgrG [Alphaproteobacteria bacterium]|nr:type VI secretion system tip protein VgrG [Alphaproteobacteria bacterium]